jgi:hypothetical protein
VYKTTYLRCVPCGWKGALWKRGGASRIALHLKLNFCSTAHGAVEAEHCSTQYTAMIMCSSEQERSLPHINAIGMHARMMSKHGCLAWLFIADSSYESYQWRALDQRFCGLRMPTTRRCGRVAIRQVYIQRIRHAGVTIP